MTFETEAALAAAVFAVDAHMLGGVCLRSTANPLRDQWLALLRDLLPMPAPVRRIPFNIADSRLLGGLDLVATLRAHRPVLERGVLASADGGILIVTMAERLGGRTAAALCLALDRSEIGVEREGISLSESARVGIVALDEGASDDEGTPRCLLDRFAFLLDFTSVTARTVLIPVHEPAEILEARGLLARVTIKDELTRALCATAAALGAGSARVTILAVRAARILAALDGRSEVVHEDAEAAGRLVLAPRARVAPEPPRTREPAEPAPQPMDPAQSSADPPAGPSSADPPRGAASEAPAESAAEAPAEPGSDELEERVLAATQSAIPSGLLARLRDVPLSRPPGNSSAMGRAGTLRKGGNRGQPTGIVKGLSRNARLNLIETLRAAAPWQAVRGREARSDSRLRIRPEDFRTTRYKCRTQTLTIFNVDASGSSALNRLAETKGAVEQVLAECYVRRDQVAVIAFRGRAVEILLPPTRSLVRAKRSLAGLPGGGATPLAAAIDAATIMASQAARRGESVKVMMLTDGRGNVARDGSTGRGVGQADAILAARRFRAARITAVFVDTSPRPHPVAQELARHMSAAYIALPFADARAISNLVVKTNVTRA